MPIVLTKSVSWASIVRLGCSLSDHCRGGGEFEEAFRLGRRCPMNDLSVGGRLAGLRGKEVEVAKATPFAWLKTKQEVDALEARLHNEKCELRGEYSNYLAVEEMDQFLHGLFGYKESEVDYLMWRSATSKAMIECFRKTHRSSSARCLVHTWTAEFHEGNKPSQYGRLWAEMSEDPSDELYPQPPKAEEPEAAARVAPAEDW